MNEDPTINNFPLADKPSKGPLLGTIIIVLIIIIGGIYIITSRRSNDTVPSPIENQPVAVPIDLNDISADAENPLTVGTELDAIETDLNASEIDLQALDNEFQ